MPDTIYKNDGSKIFNYPQDTAGFSNSEALIKEKFPQAKIIKLDKNVGYGNGNNAALEKVETEFALVLNPDAMIFENDIEIVLDAMKDGMMMNVTHMKGNRIVWNATIIWKGMSFLVITRHKDGILPIMLFQSIRWNWNWRRRTEVI